VSARSSEEPATEPRAAEPFAFGDFTWLNGNNRQKSALLDSPYFTGTALVDIGYTYSFNRPIDDTIGGATVLGRHNEVQLTMASFGGDFHYKSARATLTLQLGLYSTMTPRNDPSVNRGQWDMANAYRYIREAYAGYHWDALHGINLDVGIFMSYIGLFSYVNFENWAYQPSYVSSNTPFFFQGARLQVFPTDRFKVELWLTNGWQSYGKYNTAPGVGYQALWRPTESVSLVANGYAGTDTQDAASRIRVLSDNSLQVRYWNSPGSFVDRLAFSLTADYGFESGDGVSITGRGAPEQSFEGFMLYQRAWLAHDRFALTVGGGAIRNPGRWLVLVPPGSAPSVFAQGPGTSFNAWDGMITADYMPGEYHTFRLEFVRRVADTPYFVGHGGVTSPDGYTTTSTAGFTPDLVRSENRITAAFLFRL
jgi:hypothetical protein